MFVGLPLPCVGSCTAASCLTGWQLAKGVPLRPTNVQLWASGLLVSVPAVEIEQKRTVLSIHDTFRCEFRCA